MGISSYLRLLASILAPELLRFHDQSSHFAFPWNFYGTPESNENLGYGSSILQGDVIRLRSDFDIYQVHVFDSKVGTYWTLRDDTSQRWHGMNIAFISDIHLKQGGGALKNLELAADYLEKCKKEGATIDMIINGGDTFDYGHFPDARNMAALRRLSSLACASFSVLGNHDYYRERACHSSDNAKQVAEFLSNAGMPVLQNQSIRISGNPAATDYKFVFFDDIEAYRYAGDGIEQLQEFISTLPPGLDEFKFLLSQSIEFWKDHPSIYPGYPAALADQLKVLHEIYREKGPVALVVHNYDMAQFFLSEFHRIGSMNRYFRSDFPSIIMTAHTHATGLRIPFPIVDLSGLAMLRQHGIYHKVNKHVTGYRGEYAASYAGNSTVSVNSPGMEVDTRFGRLFTKNTGMVLLTWNGIPDCEGITPIGAYSPYARVGWRPDIKGIRPYR